VTWPNTRLPSALYVFRVDGASSGEKLDAFLTRVARLPVARPSLFVAIDAGQAFAEVMPLQPAGQVVSASAVFHRAEQPLEPRSLLLREGSSSKSKKSKLKAGKILDFAPYFGLRCAKSRRTVD